MATNASLVTTLQNTSNVDCVFGYLPPHGMRLAANETVTVFGNIVDRIAGRGPRFERAFQNDLETNAIEILSSPVPVFNQGGSAKVLADNGGTLGVADPSWDQ